jgi:MOSC domain-containing protein YiiM
MGELVSIVYKPKDAAATETSYTRLPLQEAHLVVGRGIAGDVKGASKTRQLNIMAANTVTELATEGFSASPGEMGEQLLVADVEIDGLAPGTQIRIGSSACIEVTEPRTGCGKFERYQGKRKEEASGRLGQMARVVADGVIRIGDPVEVLTTNESI